jgi:glycerophosphoryl diester phosphodiesterase
MKIIGHRGARGLAPENTLASLQKALDCRVDEIEIDVRVTKDGVPILNHDTAKQGFKIDQYELAPLRKKLTDLATLEEAIQFVKRRVPLAIEIKPGESVEPIIQILRNFLKKGWKPADFRLGSKSQKILLALHKALPNIDTIVIERWSGVRASWRARRLNTKYICMNQHFMWWGFISSMHRSGYKLSVYTLNDPKKAKAWARRGLYGVVTDHPNRF